MDDQLSGERLSLESLIAAGTVTHLCSGDSALDEAAVLTAICGAVGGQIYRIDSLTYVFRVSRDDIGGELTDLPYDAWAERIANHLRLSLQLTGDPDALQVRALRDDPDAVAAPDEMDMAETDAAETDAATDDGMVTADEMATADDAMDAPVGMDDAATDETADDAMDAAAGMDDAMDDAATAEPFDADAPDMQDDADAPAAQAEDDGAEDGAAMDADAPDDMTHDDTALDAAATEDAAEAADGIDWDADPDEAMDDDDTWSADAAEAAEADAPATVADEDHGGTIMADAGLAARVEGIEAALARIESALGGAQTAALEDRIGRLEEGLAAVAGAVAALGERVEARAPEKLLDELAQECRAIPERAAAHFSAKVGALGPLSIALASQLRRLERKPDPVAAAEPPGAEALDRIEAAVAALADRLGGPQEPAADLVARIDALAAELDSLPARAAAHMAAKSGSLVPMHVALSGALHRLESQVEAMIARGGPAAEAGPDADLRVAMAEFLSRLEHKLADAGPAH